MRDAVCSAVLFLANNWTGLLLVDICLWFFFMVAWTTRDKRRPEECRIIPLERDWSLMLLKVLVTITTTLLALAVAYKFWPGLDAIREAVHTAVLSLANDWYGLLLVAILVWVIYLGLWVSRDKRRPEECQIVPLRRDWSLRVFRVLAAIMTVLLVLAVGYKFVLLPLIAAVGGGLGSMLSQIPH